MHKWKRFNYGDLGVFNFNLTRRWSFYKIVLSFRNISQLLAELIHTLKGAMYMYMYMCRLAKPKWETKTINPSNMIQLQPEKQIDCLIVATPWQPFFLLRFFSGIKNYLLTFPLQKNLRHSHFLCFSLVFC